MKKFLKITTALCCSFVMSQSAFAADPNLNPNQAIPQNSMQQGALPQGSVQGSAQNASMNRTYSQDGFYSSNPDRNATRTDGVYYHDTYGQRGQDSTSDPTYAYDVGSDGNGGSDACCAPADQPTGDCWCLYCHYEPCYYNTYRCVQKPVYTTKKCCRYVPKYYQVQRCRYVPQYYCETKCCQVPEYYDVCECNYCTETVCDKCCKYVPKYYWKHVCNNPCDTGCAAK